MRRFMRRFGNPQDSYPAIHIAGTNGKGSVAAMTASVLQEAGFRVGLYTSPHLERINERFRINSREISNSELNSVLSTLRPAAKNLTQFEFLTGIAFLWFAREKVDVAVIEVGLGGRLDATNILSRVLASVITTIDLDHTDWLGNTFQKIAYEKAGIIKPATPVVTGANGIALQEIQRIARLKKSRVVIASNGNNLALPLKGPHQQQNASIVFSLLKVLPWSFSKQKIARGLAKTNWPGRFEKRKVRGRTIILDGAHNPAATRVLVRTLRQEKIKKIDLLFGALRDKDYRRMAKILSPLVVQGAAVPLPTNRSENARVLASDPVWKGKVVSLASISQGMKFFMNQKTRRPLVVTGSLYLVGAARKWLSRLLLLLLFASPALSAQSSATLKADQIKVDIQKSEAEATGHFELIQASGTLRGEEAYYNWKTSTGTIYDASGEDAEWRFSGDRLIQPAPNLYLLDDAIVTSCDHDPPHYFFRTSKTRVVAGKKLNMKNVRLTIDEMPILYTPVNNKSLEKKKYKLHMEPGQTTRDGFTFDTYLGVPFTPHSYTKFKLKYLEHTGYKAGIVHDYFRPDLHGHVDYERVRDYNDDPQAQSKEYRARWNHYQRLLPALTFRTNANLSSVQTFGNTYGGSSNQTYVESKTRGLLSEGEFVYQFPKASLTTFFNRNDKFDSTVSSGSFISKITLPRLSFNTTDLLFKHVPFKTSFSANYFNQTNTRNTPDVALRYEQSANATVNARREFPIKKKLVLTPNLGYQQTWQDRRTSTETFSKDIYIGKYLAGLNTRYRLTRSIDLNFSHNYRARLEENRTTLDSSADDHGVETNFLNGSVNSRFGRSTLLILSSGYDFRDAPDSNPNKYQHERSRFSPPRIDIQYEATPNVLLDFNETYALYDQDTQRNVNMPLNTSGGIQIGNPAGLVTFTQRFSYSKTQTGQDAELIFNDRLRFFLSPKWHIDLTLSFRAVGPQSFNYKKIKPIDRTITVVRDLHCWILRGTFSNRLDSREIHFYIDLKTNMAAARNVFNGRPLEEYYPYAEPTPDVSDVFPAPEEKK